MERAFGSFLCREEDKQWLTSNITSLAKQYIVDTTESDPQMFSSISPQVQSTTNNKALSINSMPSISLHLIRKWKTMEDSIRYYMTRYNEENVSNSPSLDLELQNDELGFICSIHRAIQHPRYVISLSLHVLILYV